MSIALGTGSAGLIGSETCARLHAEGMEIVGLDNDMRARFFGPGASTSGTRLNLESRLKNYTHADIAIRDVAALNEIFRRYGAAIAVVVHTAAWAITSGGLAMCGNSSATFPLGATATGSGRSFRRFTTPAPDGDIKTVNSGVGRVRSERELAIRVVASQQPRSSTRRSDCSVTVCPQFLASGLPGGFIRVGIMAVMFSSPDFQALQN